MGRDENCSIYRTFTQVILQQVANVECR
ncbi:hypothetical protein CAEBREN_12188 [Caenorhabditis brenneri]|uniref:Uncharacterized protein n=1 Tax=Caenorhabditis brenneri TaxID=135651 RepID=G0PDV0_CAEBE|nr:hypothetical protein CAEBREN_12188 [Caenorhabditis brenneri]